MGLNSTDTGPVWRCEQRAFAISVLSNHHDRDGRTSCHFCGDIAEQEPRIEIAAVAPDHDTVMIVRPINNYSSRQAKLRVRTDCLVVIGRNLSANPTATQAIYDSKRDCQTEGLSRDIGLPVWASAHFLAVRTLMSVVDGSKRSCRYR